jgi:hypothetical protein
VLPPFLWVKNSSAKGSCEERPYKKFLSLYNYLYDKRMTMVLAAPLVPQGIKFRRENHNADKCRKFLWVCQAVFLIFHLFFAAVSVDEFAWNFGKNAQNANFCLQNSLSGIFFPFSCV